MAKRARAVVSNASGTRPAICPAVAVAANELPDGVAAVPGFRRVTVIDARGALSSPQRRVDNLGAMVRAIGGERVKALMALREAMEEDLRASNLPCPLAALDRVNGGGGVPDAFAGLVWARMSRSAMLEAMWGAVPADCRGAVLMVVANGWTIEAAAAKRKIRAGTARAAVKGELRRAADAVAAVIDARWGRARMRAVRGA